ncbi:arylamine N-acetyltransferase family protein [Couchioplanes caeruleus]|uniref:Acetyltransferase n=2 Tax=Couchioplanes caeruleus TaxID=56438 RepID=A0A1K0FQZ3_9ACTN|nr:arylamine N-acetyltransferase [Couchioplanes caeruleus]OJF15209.1 acetyltransferase [Couchioplanes caeruleus subsp. caeruleus]ROP28010.1 N-hydroxyarylamine O-acetyltransferase [Couchioplanes caeruleus]
MIDRNAVAAYLDRIGGEPPAVVDAAALRRLHRAHLTAVPFENLSIHLGEAVSLDPDALVDKLVRRHRGGFCYELNGAFALLLEALGCRVTRVAARVFDGDQLTPPFDHLALVARPVDGSGPWLVDVGFGRHSVYPLHFAERAEQHDPGGQFTLVERDHGDVDVLLNGTAQYRVERRERTLADFVPACWWHATSPDSHFRRGPVCSRLTADGRVSLSGRRLTVTGVGGRAEHDLAGDDDALVAYREHFGIDLAAPPAVAPGDRREARTSAA